MLVEIGTAGGSSLGPSSSEHLPEPAELTHSEGVTQLEYPDPSAHVGGTFPGAATTHPYAGRDLGRRVQPPEPRRSGSCVEQAALKGALTFREGQGQPETPLLGRSPDLIHPIHPLNSRRGSPDKPNQSPEGEKALGTRTHHPAPLQSTECKAGGAPGTHLAKSISPSVKWKS